MPFLVTGLLLLVALVGLFWAKERLRSPVLRRIAYSDAIVRLLVVALGLLLLGLTLTLGRLFE